MLFLVADLMFSCPVDTTVGKGNANTDRPIGSGYDDVDDACADCATG